MNQDIPIEVSSMGIVFLKSSLAELSVVILKCGNGEWVFPKGHVENEESLIKTACREVKEESGIVVREEECLGLVDEHSYYINEGKVLKLVIVHVFVITESQEIKLNPKESFVDGKWVTLSEAFNVLAHEDSKNSLKRALKLYNDQMHVAVYNKL